MLNCPRLRVPFARTAQMGLIPSPYLISDEIRQNINETFPKFAVELVERHRESTLINPSYTLVWNCQSWWYIVTGTRDYAEDDAWRFEKGWLGCSGTRSLYEGWIPLDRSSRTHFRWYGCRSCNIYDSTMHRSWGPEGKPEDDHDDGRTRRNRSNILKRCLSSESSLLVLSLVSCYCGCMATPAPGCRRARKGPPEGSISRKAPVTLAKVLLFCLCHGFV